MPKDTSIKKVLIIGSGPIIIGQACEFDYSGTQGAKALKEEGIKIVLVNSNPATIMTDPIFADATYIEPLSDDILEKIIAREKPDCLLPTLGGQTALNIATQLYEKGILQKYGVRLIGANYEAIKRAEDRLEFKKVMEENGLPVPKSAYVTSVEEALECIKSIGLPCVIRPSYTLGGTGGGIAYNMEELKNIVKRGLSLSLIGKVLIEESLYGWKEFELEVMRDKNDNCIIICSIENFDPMGIHTGDSITVAPIQTLTDKEYQKMREMAIKVIRVIGVETGGSNIQFAVNPNNGKMYVIEINPRVSRSSALASKATGFPIAKIAAKLAIGYTLDEIPNDITRKTPSSFEPVIDYCVVKIPKWAVEKFPEVDHTLTTQMKSIGEVMSIGRNFKEALQKAIRALEENYEGIVLHGKEKKFELETITDEQLISKLTIPHPHRYYYIPVALKRGFSPEIISEITKIDRWFIGQIKEIVEIEEALKNTADVKKLSPSLLLNAKQIGFSDTQIATALNCPRTEIENRRSKMSIVAKFNAVDTCAGEFEAVTPYYYSSYGLNNDLPGNIKNAVIILGAGPNRIGQGIEFDYCSVHGILALKKMGYTAIMINSNPETVSTDYDTSDILFFEPINTEHILEICRAVKPVGIISQFGGQTPLNIAKHLQSYGIKILGTDSQAIELAENRELCSKVLKKYRILTPDFSFAKTLEEGVNFARRIGFPVIVRPSFVLGGRAMKICYDSGEVVEYLKEALEVCYNQKVLIDKFLEDAIECDVDAISDGKNVWIGGILQHIEYAGVHSGDAHMVFPPIDLSEKIIAEIEAIVQKLGIIFGIVGLYNVQVAIKDGKVYVLEINPRASRTVPFLSKALGVSIAEIATYVIMGKKLDEFKLPYYKNLQYYAVKTSVFPFDKLSGCDIVAGPEMKSTGEVMGIDDTFGFAFYKAMYGSGFKLPVCGNVFLTVRDKDKLHAVEIARRLQNLGFKILATKGTREVLLKNLIESQLVYKVAQGRPNGLDYILNRQVDLIINTPAGKGPKTDEAKIRQLAFAYKIPVLTTIEAAYAAISGIEAIKKSSLSVRPIQEFIRWNK